MCVGRQEDGADRFMKGACSSHLGPTNMTDGSRSWQGLYPTRFHPQPYWCKTFYEDGYGRKRVNRCEALKIYGSCEKDNGEYCSSTCAMNGDGLRIWN